MSDYKISDLPALAAAAVTTADAMEVLNANTSKRLTLAAFLASTGFDTQVRTIVASATSGGTIPTGAAHGSLDGTYPNPTLAVTGVTAATYGDGPTRKVGTFTVNSEGRITAASDEAIAQDLTGAVRYDTGQALTGGQQTLARSNIVAAKYDDNLLAISNSVIASASMAVWTAPGVAHFLVVQSFMETFLAATTTALAQAAIGITEKRYQQKQSVNMDVAADMGTFTMPAKYRIDKITVFDASATPVLGTIGVFTAATGGGTAIVTAVAPVSLTSAPKVLDLTLVDATTYKTATTLYLYNSVAQGSALTATILIEYLDLT